MTGAAMIGAAMIAADNSLPGLTRIASSPPLAPQRCAVTTLLVKYAAVLVTMDFADREIQDGGLFCRDRAIEQVGASADLPTEADESLDLTCTRT